MKISRGDLLKTLKTLGSALTGKASKAPEDSNKLPARNQEAFKGMPSASSSVLETGAHDTHVPTAGCIGYGEAPTVAARVSHFDSWHADRNLVEVETAPKEVDANTLAGEGWTIGWSEASTRLNAKARCFPSYRTAPDGQVVYGIAFAQHEPDAPWLVENGVRQLAGTPTANGNHALMAKRLNDLAEIAYLANPSTHLPHPTPRVVVANLEGGKGEDFLFKDCTAEELRQFRTLGDNTIVLDAKRVLEGYGKEDLVVLLANRAMFAMGLYSPTQQSELMARAREGDVRAQEQVFFQKLFVHTALDHVSAINLLPLPSRDFADEMMFRASREGGVGDTNALTYNLKKGRIEERDPPLWKELLTRLFQDEAHGPSKADVRDSGGIRVSITAAPLQISVVER